MALVAHRKTKEDAPIVEATRQIAEFVAALEFDGLPDDVVARVKLLVLDIGDFPQGQLAGRKDNLRAAAAPTRSDYPG